ncbi:septum formation family protein [Amycolatopsis sp. NPDC048633]|uniref:DUF4190 domain-containing protein n=1 Tax=Amycolatopsis sp. NPDC048633 TaxID=3157095 RepID=UPI0033C8D779
MFDETRSTLSSHAQTTVHGPVESAGTDGTDGFAVASLLCGLLGLVPFSAVFGIRALARIGGSGRSGRGLAITGLVLSVLWLGVGLATVGPKVLAHPAHVLASGGPDYIHVMAAGDCFDSGGDGEHVTRTPCDRPHDEQIFARIDVGTGSETYPGLPAIREPALVTCRIAAAAYFTEGTPPPALEFFAHLPTEGSWIGGVRTAACTFGRPGGKLTAFIRP